jgi:6,7-dimethyl-8-ribityllumazine synthase
VRTFEGSLDASGLRVAVVASRFDKTGEGIPERLCDGAVREALERGVPQWALAVVRVPGAYELPLAAQWLAESGRFDAIACVGCVIRGETPHFDYVAGEAARGVAEVARAYALPVAFGVITADTDDQARARAGDPSDPAAHNKGREAMRAAIEMATLARGLRTGERT